MRKGNNTSGERMLTKSARLSAESCKSSHMPHHKRPRRRLEVTFDWLQPDSGTSAPLHRAMPRSSLVLLALLGASVAGANSAIEKPALADPSAAADDVPNNKQQQGRKLVNGLPNQEDPIGNSHWHSPTPSHGHSPHLHEPHTHRESTAATSEPSPLLYFSLAH